jgi:hypothetical protein
MPPRIPQTGKLVFKPARTHSAAGILNEARQNQTSVMPAIRHMAATLAKPGNPDKPLPKNIYKAIQLAVGCSTSSSAAARYRRLP